MNPKVIISFFVGAATGVGGSFIFFKKYFEKKMAKEILEMREFANDCKRYGIEMKEYADEMYELATGKNAPEDGFNKEEIVDYLSKNNKYNRRNPEKEIVDIEDAYNSVQEAIAEEENNGYLDSLIDYTAYSKDKSAYEHPNDDVGMARIELISAEEYDNSNPMNVKLCLEYYEEDDILCYEETGEIVENPEELIGMEALHAFGSPDYEDPDEIFVRNNQKSADYQVILHDGSYKDAYGGYY